ncbi:hypothetical protein EVJ58_g6614 [Rhodofomes roseus]|uniref:RING-type domain-containing protein n=1 Tax=Rhodofomes roseus TaxID=34475 RepID=A0A4Y9Y9G7_9APHY|nr:hypothetical protein EVJ58_g6614 [Rhodofomes roseus]
MPVTRGQSVRPHQQYSPVAAPKPDDSVIIISSDDERPFKANATPRRARSKQKNRALAPPSAEVVEISSDDEAVAARPKPLRRQQQDVTASLRQQLKEALQEVERLRTEARAAEKQKAVAQPVDSSLLGDVEEVVTCEICTFKMWAPYALPCGHTFCQSCLQDWFGTAQATHLANYPQSAQHDNLLAELRASLRRPNLTPQRRTQMQVQLAQFEAMCQRPKYTCPTCRTECKTRPTEVFVLKAIVERVGKAQGESAPEKIAPSRTRAGQVKLIDGPFDGFFP